MPQHLKLFLKALLFLFAVAFLGKAAFALYHGETFASLSIGETVYALLWGFRFDLALAAVFTLIAYVGAYLAHRLARLPFASALRHLSFLAAALIIILHGADALYYGEAGRHLGYELKELYNSREALMSAATGTYILPVTLYLLGIVPFYFVARWWLTGTSAASEKPRGFKRLGPELQLFSVLLIGGLAVRGGLQQVPMEPLHAQQIGDSRQATLALDGAYNALFSSATPYAITPVLNKAPSGEQVAMVRRMYSSHSSTPLPSAETPPNVVMIFLEGWSAIRMHSYGNELVVTPFFDELRAKSLTTRGMLAGGRRTTEGLFATLCSAQNPLGQTVAQTQLQNYDYYCLPRLLRDRGYYSAFFQGTKKNTSGTGAFAQLLGFTDSYGIEDAHDIRYPTNSWGLHDPDVYAMVFERLQSASGPFFIGINTNTTHDHQLPPGAATLLPDEDRAASDANVLHFADSALRAFAEQLYANPKTRNTLLVVVADHAGADFDSAYSRFLVPFLIYHPQLAPLDQPIIASQRDIPPTVLELLGEEIPGWYMGHSLLQAAAGSHPADFFHQGELGWVEGNTLVIQHTTTHTPTQCYDIGPTVARLTARPCLGEDATVAKRALAFTTVAQHHLFAGDLRKFPANLPQETD